MLANRLSVLLAERQLSIKQVVDETGISRNTISNISNNVGANIATETIDSLCRYLNVEPAEFFSYTPYDFSIKLEKETGYDSSVQIDVTRNRTEKMYSLNTYYNETTADMEEKATLVDFDLYIIVDDGFEDNNDSLVNIFESLPVVFQTRLSNMLLEILSEQLNRYNDSISLKKGTEYVRVSIRDYLSQFNQKQITTLIRLPWGDYKRMLDINKRVLILH